MRVILCLLLAASVAALAPSKAPSKVPQASRRAVLSAFPMAAASFPALAFDLPSLPSMPNNEAEKPQPVDKDAAKKEREAKQAAMMRVRAQRMAAEARARSEDYARTQANVGTMSFGSTTSVR